MSDVSIVRHTAEFDEIVETLNTLAPAIVDIPNHLLVITLVALCLLVQRPEMTREELLEGVKGTTDWMSLYISTLADTTGSNEVH